MKRFIFRYDPQHSVRQMFTDMKQAINNKEKNIQPKNVVITNNVEVIYRVLNKSRLDLYSCLVEKQPSSLKELARLVNRNYQEVEEDVNMLIDLGIIRLIKQETEVKPVALYEKVVIEFPTLTNKRPESSRQISPN